MEVIWKLRKKMCWIRLRIGSLYYYLIRYAVAAIAISFVASIIAVWL